MGVFEELKLSLKDKWLEYYQTNRSWIQHTHQHRTSTFERPSSYIILGAISALEPKINEFLIGLCEINKSGDDVVKVLGLHFDPEKELEERAENQQAEIVSPESDPDTEYLNKIREENK